MVDEVVEGPLVDAPDDKDGGEGEEQKPDGCAYEMLENGSSGFAAHQQ